MVADTVRRFFLVWGLLVLLALPAAAEAPRRVVSIGGALTEIVYALEAQEVLVGNDTTSYYPPAAEHLPKVGYQRALSAEGIVSLSPDLVMLTEEAGPPAVLAQLQAANIPILQLRAGRSLTDVRDAIRVIARALKKDQAGSALIDAIDRQTAELAKVTARHPTDKRVLFILQHGGGAPMAGGRETAADSIIRLSGAQNAVTEYTGYKPLTPEAAAALQPDVILTTARGLAQAGGKDALLAAPGLSLTPAARTGSLIVMDALLLLGFGPRTVQAAATLHEAYQGL